MAEEESSKIAGTMDQDQDKPGQPTMAPGARSGEGAASVLRHLERQQHSRPLLEFPRASIAELEAAATNAKALADLLQADYVAAVERRDSQGASALAADLKTLRELENIAKAKLTNAKLAAALDGQSGGPSSQG